MMRTVDGTSVVKSRVRSFSNTSIDVLDNISFFLRDVGIEDDAVDDVGDHEKQSER